MANQALVEVKDWSDPAQYPFALAVYARKHGQVRVPLAKGLRPIFDAACSRLESANSTQDTWKIAEWVYKQLMTPTPPEPPVNKRVDSPTKPSDSPTEPSNDEGEGDPQDEADEGTGEAKTPRRANGKDVNPRSTEPDVDLPPESKSGGATSETDIRKEGYHVDTKRWTISI
jgi:hypothetical protein